MCIRPARARAGRALGAQIARKSMPQAHSVGLHAAHGLRMVCAPGAQKGTLKEQLLMNGTVHVFVFCHLAENCQDFQFRDEIWRWDAKLTANTSYVIFYPCQIAKHPSDKHIVKFFRQHKGPKGKSQASTILMILIHNIYPSLCLDTQSTTFLTMLWA